MKFTPFSISPANYPFSSFINPRTASAVVSTSNDCPVDLVIEVMAPSTRPSPFYLLARIVNKVLPSSSLPELYKTIDTKDIK